MHRIPSGRRLVALLLLTLLSCALGGCGNKGPLYLPGNGTSSSAQQGG